MPVLRGCDIRVLAAMRVHIIGNPLGDRVAACDTQFAAFTERRLHIHTISALVIVIPLIALDSF